MTFNEMLADLGSVSVPHLALTAIRKELEDQKTWDASFLHPEKIGHVAGLPGWDRGALLRLQVHQSLELEPKTRLMFWDCFASWFLHTRNSELSEMFSLTDGLFPDMDEYPDFDLMEIFH